MKLRLEPGESREIHKAGYSFYVQAVGSDGDAEIEVRIDGESEILKPGEGIPSNGVMFHSVTVVNLQNTAIMLDYVIASNNRGLVSNRLSGVVNVDGVVQVAPDYSRTKSGEAYLASWGQSAVAGEFSYIQLWNPVDSGYDIVIPRFYLTQVAAAALRFDDTEITAGSAGVGVYAEKAPANLRLGSASQSAVIKRVTSSDPNLGRSGAQDYFSGGNVDGGLVDFTQPFVVPPGMGISIRSIEVNTAFGAAFPYFEVSQ